MIPVAALRNGGAGLRGCGVVVVTVDENRAARTKANGVMRAGWQCTQVRSTRSRNQVLHRRGVRIGRVVRGCLEGLDGNLGALCVRVACGHSALSRYATKRKDDCRGKDAEHNDDDEELDQSEPRLDDFTSPQVILHLVEMLHEFVFYLSYSQDRRNSESPCRQSAKNGRPNCCNEASGSENVKGRRPVIVPKACAHKKLQNAVQPPFWDSSGTEIRHHACSAVDGSNGRLRCAGEGL